jgi:hypothetical protein
MEGVEKNGRAIDARVGHGSSRGWVAVESASQPHQECRSRPRVEEVEVVRAARWVSGNAV